MEVLNGNIYTAKKNIKKLTETGLLTLLTRRSHHFIIFFLDIVFRQFLKNLTTVFYCFFSKMISIRNDLYFMIFV